MRLCLTSVDLELPAVAGLFELLFHGELQPTNGSCVSQLQPHGISLVSFYLEVKLPHLSRLFKHANVFFSFFMLMYFNEVFDSIPPSQEESNLRGAKGRVLGSQYLNAIFTP